MQKKTTNKETFEQIKRKIEEYSNNDERTIILVDASGNELDRYDESKEKETRK